MSTAPTDLRLVCTDRGRHPSRDLALINWAPASLEVEGFAVWDASEDLSENRPSVLAESGRTTAAGQWRTTSRRAVTTHERADGGRTFELPPCPTCGPARPGRLLRDDTLGRLLRVAGDTRTARVDVSAMP